MYRIQIRVSVSSSLQEDILQPAELGRLCDLLQEYTYVCFDCETSEVAVDVVTIHEMSAAELRIDCVANILADEERGTLTGIIKSVLFRLNPFRGMRLQYRWSKLLDHAINEYSFRRGVRLRGNESGESEEAIRQIGVHITTLIADYNHIFLEF